MCPVGRSATAPVMAPLSLPRRLLTRTQRSALPGHLPLKPCLLALLRHGLPRVQELLRGLPALEWLPDGPLTALAINATLRQYAPGEVGRAAGVGARRWGRPV
jgi:hypothetical protein